MKLTTAVASLALAGQAIAKPLENGNCKKDTCFNAVAGQAKTKYSSDCKAFLWKTFTPRARTVYQTITVSTTPQVNKSATRTSTRLVTTTRTTSVVRSEITEVTKTDTVSETATQTTQTTVTAGEPLHPEYRRGDSQIKGKCPGYAGKACKPFAYASACSCLGITASTKTAACPTTTVVVRKTVTAPARTVTKTVQTVYKSTTAATVDKTSTYSTETVTRTAKTETLSVTDATRTVAATSTIRPEYPNPTMDVYLTMRGNQSPRFEGSSVLYVSLGEQPRTSPAVFDVKLIRNRAEATPIKLDLRNGHLFILGHRVRTRPDESFDGHVMVYSYVENSAPMFFVSQSVAARYPGLDKESCIAGANGQISCMWSGSRNARFYTCDDHMVISKPVSPASSCPEDFSQYTPYEGELGFELV